MAALAGNRLLGRGQCAHILAIQVRAAVRMLPQLEYQQRVAGSMQVHEAACQHSRRSGTSLQTRRLARARAQADYRCCCNTEPDMHPIQEGAAVRTFSKAENRERVGAVARAAIVLPTSPAPHNKSTHTTGGKGTGSGWAPETCAPKSSCHSRRRCCTHAHSS